MKNFKLTKGVQILLLTILIISIAVIAVGILLENKALAATKNCTVQGCDGIMDATPTTNNGTAYGTHTWTCRLDGHTQTENCSPTNYWYYHDNNIHYSYCWACGDYYSQESCYDDDGDGSCDADCGNDEMHSHSYSSKTVDNGNGTHSIVKSCSCGDSYTESTSNHSFGSYSDTGNGYHSASCSSCPAVDQKEHSYDSYTDNGNGTHSASCTECTNRKTENHYGATHENGGKCTAINCESVYETHGQSTNITDYDITEEGHTPIYGCIHADCDKTYIGEIQNHTGGTHENEGKCQLTACGYQYQNHSQSINVKEYESNENGHTAIYECTYSGCTSTYKGTQENHEGATHENGGKCTVEGCGYKYENHGESENITDYDITADGHTPIYACTFYGCDKTFRGEIQNHIGGTHENEGRCQLTACGYQYQNHGQSTNIKEYTISETEHTPVYECLHEGCEATYNGTEENHIGATHENEGKCTVCDHKYEIHGESQTVKEYKTTETGHIPVYKCLDTNCEETYDGTEESHTGGTHENEGKCTVEGCGYQYQKHEISKTISSYQITDTMHTAIYKCLYPGCGVGEFDITSENHLGATHENGGKCTVCNHKYENHGKSTTIKEYESREEGHTPIYKCTDSNCDKIYKGTEEEHTVEEWSDAGEGKHSGDCTICYYKVTDFHNYGDKECEDCGSEKPKEECKHTYEEENDKNNHWEECTKCGEEKEGSKEPHNYDEYTDNEDGTHSSTCTDCEYELTEEHNYEDEKCEKCNADEPKEECKHSYKVKNNQKQHWEECTECKEEKEGSRANHTYKDYEDNGNGTHSATCTKCNYKMTEKHKTDGTSCKECGNKEVTTYPGNKDNTTTDKEIPKAGITSMIIIFVIAIGTVLVISITKMNKYKDI